MSYPWVILQLKKLLQEINTVIAAHNVANDSHPDLRATIDMAIECCEDHIVDPTAHQDIRDEIDTKIGDHDVDPNAHQDIRSLVGGGVATHDTDPTAHQDIRDLIDGLEFIKDVSFDPTTGDLTFTRRDDVTLVINVFADNLIEEITYDSTTNELVMTRHDGSESRLDISQFAGSYFGEQGEHIDINVGSDKSIKADLRPGSISEKELDVHLVENLQNTFCIARYLAENGRIGWLTTSAIASGSTMKLPMKYIPGKNMFLLFYKGVACIPRGGPTLEPGTRYQYQEVNTPGKAMSDEIIIYFDVEADKTFDMWICGSTSESVTVGGSGGIDCPIDRSCLEQDVQDSLDLADTALQSLPAHTHDKSEIDNFDHDHVKTDITDFAHTHTMSDITDLECITKAEFNDTTKILTITKQDNSTETIDLSCDTDLNCIKNMALDPTTHELVVTLYDDDIVKVDLSSLSGGSGGISFQEMDDAIVAAINSLRNVVDDAFNRSSDALNLARDSVPRSHMPNMIYGTDSVGNQTVIDAGNISSAIGGSGVPDSVYGTGSYGEDIMIPISYLTGSVVTNPSLPKVIGISVAFGRVELTIDRPVEANTYLVTYWRYRRRSGFGKNGKPIKHTHCFRKINTLGTNTSNVGNGGPFADFVGTLVPPNTTTFLLSEPIQQLHVPYRVSSKASRFNTKNMYVHGVGAAGGKDPSRCNKVRWKFGLHSNTNVKLVGEPSVQTLEIMERFKPIASGFQGILSYKII